jgi:hypothetical protein
MESIEETYEGQTELHKVALKLLPAIVAHFASYTGRAATDSGRSAYFDKVIQAFYRDCKELSTARVIVNDNYSHSIYIDIDIHLPAHKASHVNYFKVSFHLGGYEDRDFKYEFDFGATDTRCRRVIETPIGDILHARDTLVSFKKKISAVKESVPTAFTSLMDVRYH